MDKKIADLFENLRKRNISGFYCDDNKQAADKILEIIPVSSSIGISGSLTLDQIAVVKRLSARGNKFFDQYKTGISREESLDLRRQGAQADYYLASANAISEAGELVFFSAYGNRTAGISYGKNVIVVCGTNKLVKDIDTALKRAREYAAPLNCKRLNWNSPCFKDGLCRKEICFPPDYKRMCCQILIIEGEVLPDRLRMVLVGEELGF